MYNTHTKFEIECEQSLGWSHSGEVTAKGKSFVELTDEEVTVLVNLIREKRTTDVEMLELREKHPALYDKLDKAYYKMAYKAEELHWLIEGLEYDEFEYDDEKVIKYCEENCGYEFVPKIDDAPDTISPEYIAALLEMYKEDMNKKRWDFRNWLPNYLRSINLEEACDFMYNHLNASIEMDDVDYVVGIPQAIIDMAKVND